MPSFVRSVNAASATSAGRTQVTPFSRGASAKGESGRLSVESRRVRLRSSSSSNPVPILPAKRSFPCGVVGTHQQRAEPAARTAGRGVAADHEVLALAALQLDPGLRAAGDVHRIGELADQPLQAELARVLEHLFGVAAEVLAVAHLRRGLERLGEALLALGESEPPQVLPGQEGRVEHVVRDLRVAPRLESVLQRLEARAAFRAGHRDLAVEPGITEPELTQRGREMRQTRGPVLARAGEQAHLARPVEAREHPVTVVLDLVEPVPGARRRADEGREHRRDELGELAFLGARGLFRYALYAFRALARDVDVALREFVVALDQQPLRLVLGAARARENPAAVQLLAVEAEMKPAFAQRLERVALVGRPRAPVP